MKKSGFTLIELLVVIAIIAILVGIAMPALSKAREKARSMTDANNLKNIGVGILAYVNDNDDTMFSAASNPPWPQRLQQQYVTEWKVFQSPFDSRPATTGASVQNVSYGLNQLCLAPTNPRGQSVGNYTNASGLILAAPNPAPGGSNIVFEGKSNMNVVRPLPAAAQPGGTHANRKQINALFADTHVSPNMAWSTFADSTSIPAGKARWDPLFVPPTQ